MNNNKSDKFLSVIESNKGILYKITNSYCQNRDDRKDLIQEIIIQLWQSFDKYNNDYKHSTWIYRIALNVAISFYRNKNRRMEISNPLPEGVLNYNNSNVLDDTDEDIKFLQQFISELKELDKALMLLYLEEKSHKQISEIIGLSETNVATKIGRIKKLLKQKFSFIKNR